MIKVSKNEKLDIFIFFPSIRMIRLFDTPVKFLFSLYVWTDPLDLLSLFIFNFYNWREEDGLKGKEREFNWRLTKNIKDRGSNNSCIPLRIEDYILRKWIMWFPLDYMYNKM